MDLKRKSITRICRTRQSPASNLSCFYVHSVFLWRWHCWQPHLSLHHVYIQKLKFSDLYACHTLYTARAFQVQRCDREIISKGEAYKRDTIISQSLCGSSDAPTHSYWWCRVTTQPWASCLIRKIAGYACPLNAGNISPPPTSKEPAIYWSRHASRYVRHARAVMHVRIVNPRWRRKLMLMGQFSPFFSIFHILKIQIIV